MAHLARASAAVDGPIHPVVVGATTRTGIDARALAAWCAASLGVSLLGTNPVYRGLLALAALNLLAVGARPGRFRGFGRVLLVIGVLNLGLNIVLGHSGVHAYAALPAWIPLVGGPLTIESLAYGASSSLGIIAAVLAVAPLTIIGDIDEMVDALPSGLRHTGSALAATLNLVPALGRSVVAVRDAQRMRGWRPRRFGLSSVVLLPVMLGAIESSVQVAEAMASRAYDSGPRTAWRRSPWSARDTFVVTAAGGAVAAFIAARMTGANLDWYPYPAMALPAITPPMVAACLLLVAPSVAWSRPSSG